MLERNVQCSCIRGRRVLVGGIERVLRGWREGIERADAGLILAFQEDIKAQQQLFELIKVHRSTVVIIEGPATTCSPHASGSPIRDTPEGLGARVELRHKLALEHLLCKAYVHCGVAPQLGPILATRTEYPGSQERTSVKKHSPEGSQVRCRWCRRGRRACLG